jgi:membrane protein implicated in regulation of membrane protease activity
MGPENQWIIYQTFNPSPTQRITLIEAIDHCERVMKPLHLLMSVGLTFLFLISLAAGPFAFAFLLLIFAVVAAVIYVRTMNRQQQAEAMKRAQQQADVGPVSTTTHTP